MLSFRLVIVTWDVACVLIVFILSNQFLMQLLSRTIQEILSKFLCCSADTWQQWLQLGLKHLNNQIKSLI